MPLSSAYDFIGELPVRSRLTGRIIRFEEEETQKNEKVEEQEKVPEEEPFVEEPTEEVALEETKEPEVETVSEEEENTAVESETNTLPEPEKIVEESPAPLTYFEIDYESIDRSNPMKSLPLSDKGNYIVVYKTENCPWCDKLIAEYKGKSEAYILVVIRCRRSIIDLYYNRFVYNFPSWVIITNKRVTYYGNGYYSWENFKGML